MADNIVKSLKIENFKRIKFVRIIPEKTTVIIKGNNGEGKTSATDALVAILCGKRFFPEKPIREGEQNAKVEAEIGEITIKRTWELKSDGRIVEKTSIHGKDNRKIEPPQTYLDAMFSDEKFVSFDPSRFIREEKTQRAVLLKLMNIDEQLNKIDEQKKHFFEQRTVINRSIRDQKGVIEELPIIGDDIPGKLIDASALSSELSDASKTNMEIKQARKDLENFKNHKDRLASDKEKNEKKLLELQREIEELKLQIDSQEKELDCAKVDLAEREKAVSKLQEINVSDILTRIREINADNQKITEANQQRKFRKMAEEKLYKLEQESEEFTRDIEALEYQKTTLLKNAYFPVKGLSVDDENVLYNGIPLQQESDAKRLVIAMEIAIAKIPEGGFRIIRMKEAALFDDKTMKQIDDLAKERDVQIFLERVGTSGPGHLIEDGLLIEEE